MTTQVYQAGDGQLASEHDHMGAEDSPIEPVTSLAAETDTDETDTAGTDTAETDTAGTDTAETDTAETDTAGTDTAETDTDETDADQAAHEDLLPDGADAVALGDGEAASFTVPGYPDFTPDADDGAQEPEMADRDPGRPSLVSAAFTVPESAPEPHSAAIAASTEGPWNEVQAIFVDDPRASVARAADLVDDRVEALIQSVRARQQSILSAGQSEHAGTEELRVALQHYRTFWHSLEDLPEPR
jgi:hypothetical protein